MNILVLNCGSSSLKFQLIETSLEQIEQVSDHRLAHGLIERIGGAAVITFVADGFEPYRSAEPIKNLRAGLERVLKWITSDDSNLPYIRSSTDIHAVGHRVVHGGEFFTGSVIVSNEVVSAIEDCIELAPLHNPGNIEGINAIRDLMGRDKPQVAVFDTAFHQTLPDHAYLYALPYQLYRRHKLRRYGFHGTSHRYVAYRYRRIKKIPREEVNLITLHLGNGCSVAAIRNGRSVDVSMGLTPLEGLVMGTRSGDLDPAIVEFIAAKEGFSVHEVVTLLNNQSGLLGISGLTNDMRELIAESEENDDRRAQLAIEIFCYRASKYIGAFLAATNGTDAIIFTGGIGENSAKIRKMICERLGFAGVVLDDNANLKQIDGAEGSISSDKSTIAVYIVPTNEELLIARDTVRLVESSK
jgi:acetate kinase